MLRPTLRVSVLALACLPWTGLAHAAECDPADSSCTVTEGPAGVADAFAGMDQMTGQDDLRTATTVLRTATDTGWWATGSLQSLDGDTSHTLAFGRGFDYFGVFVSASRGNLGVNDSDVTRHDLLLGVHAVRSLGGKLEASGMAYAGHGSLDADTDSGTGTSDDLTLGLAGQIKGALGLRSTISAEAGMATHHYDGFGLTGLDDSSFGSRDVTTTHVSVEAGLGVLSPFVYGLVPYIGADLIKTDGGQVDMSTGEASSSFDTGGKDSTRIIRIGATFGTNLPVTLRGEARMDEDGDTGAEISAAFRF